MRRGSIEIPPPDCSESVQQPYVGNVSIDHKVPGTLLLIYIELQSNGTLNKETGELERRDIHLPDLVSIEQSGPLSFVEISQGCALIGLDPGIATPALLCHKETA